MRKNMKVLWFSNTPSGASDILGNKISKNTGNWISSLELEIRTVSDIELGVAFHIPANDASEIKIIKNNSVTYFVLPKKKRSRIFRMYRNWVGEADDDNLLQQYLSVINTFKPDVIHIFGFENSFIKILPEHSNNTIIHIQGILNVIIHFINGGFSKFELIKATSIWNIMQGSFYARTIVAQVKKMAIAESSSFKSCKYLFGRTEWDKRVSQTMAPNAKYFHCNEIMRKEFYENIWDKKRCDEIILYSTLNDIPYKGVDQIFYVDEILQKFHPQLKYRWRVAGLDETSLCIRVMRNRGYKQTRRLEFIGRLSANEIIAEMKKSDIFVYTSMIENGCNAVQEAMLIGMPIVSTSAGGLSSTIHNQQTGLLFQPNDPYSMTGAILYLIDDYEFAVKLGQNAKTEAREKLNRERIAETVLLAYKEIISNN
jgi:glycosyltransferase involved in cell wall biosynthesis